MKFRVACLDYNDSVGILICEEDYNGRITHVADQIQPAMRPHDMNLIHSPTLQMSSMEAAALMTRMWEAGVRPHGIKTQDGEVRRLENHLADMRRLVFDSTATPAAP